MLTLQDWESLATTIAIVVGGVWTYFRFFKGRLAAPRLETHCSSEVVHDAKSMSLIVKLDVKNVGPAKGILKEEGCFLTVYCFKSRTNVDFFQKTPLHEIAVFKILEKHKWIEPGKNVHEEVLFSVPEESPYLAFQLECSIVYKNYYKFLPNILDTATVVVTIPKPVGNNEKE